MVLAFRFDIERDQMDSLEFLKEEMRITYTWIEIISRAGLLMGKWIYERSHVG